MPHTIAIFSANFLPNLGGVELVTDSVSKALAAHGHKVVIVTNNCFGLEGKEKLAENVTIYRLPCYPLLKARLPFPKFNFARKKLLKELQNEGIDMVVVNTRFYPHSYSGIRFARSSKVNPIVIDHGSAYVTFGIKALDPFVIIWERAMTTILKPRCHDFYGISTASAQWLKTFGIDAKGTINNAIDAKAFLASSSHRNFLEEARIDSGTFVVTFTGRLIPEKGIMPLVEAASLLKNEDIVFFVAGEGSLKSQAEANNPGNIHFLGRIGREDIPALLEQSDALCLPTRSEGFSTSMLEAAACKAIPIMPNVGGVEDFMAGQDCGIILKDTSPQTIAEAIMTAKNNPDFCLRLSKNAYNRALNCFSWSNTANQIIDACEKANRIS